MFTHMCAFITPLSFVKFSSHSNNPPPYTSHEPFHKPFSAFDSLTSNSKAFFVSMYVCLLNFHPLSIVYVCSVFSPLSLSIHPSSFHLFFYIYVHGAEREFVRAAERKWARRIHQFFIKPLILFFMLTTQVFLFLLFSFISFFFFPTTHRPMHCLDEEEVGEMKKKKLSWKDFALIHLYMNEK